MNAREEPSLVMNEFIRAEAVRRKEELQCRMTIRKGLRVEMKVIGLGRIFTWKSGSSILLSLPLMYRFLERDWTLRMLHLWCCFYLTSKDSFLMLERGCSNSIRSIRLSYPRDDISLQTARDYGYVRPWKGKALSLRPGPKYNELQSRIPVMADHDNIMVHPNYVMGPRFPGPIMFLGDCSTEARVDDLLSTTSLDSYCSGNSPENDKMVSCIVHLSPSSVITSPNFQKWMEKFSPVQHITAGHQTILANQSHICRKSTQR